MAVAAMRRRPKWLHIVTIAVLWFSAVSTTASCSTSSDGAPVLELSIIGGDTGPAIQTDEQSDLVAVFGAQRGLTDFAFRGDRLLVPRRLLETDYNGNEWISFPASAAIVDPTPYTPARVARAFEFNSRRCRRPSSDADAIVKDTMIQDFGGQSSTDDYRLCGGGFTGNAFADGKNVRVRQQTLEPSSAFDDPTVLPIEEAGSEAPDLLAAAHEAAESG